MRDFDNNWFAYSEVCGYKTKLTDVTLFEEGGQYYFSAAYEVESKSEKFLLEIPRIRIPIVTNSVQIYREFTTSDVWVNMGFGGIFRAEEDEDGYFLRETTIEEEVHELTLDDIEKKLGYKVKIVNRD